MKRIFVPLSNDDIDEIGLIDARLEIRRVNARVDELEAELSTCKEYARGLEADKPATLTPRKCVTCNPLALSKHVDDAKKCIACDKPNDIGDLCQQCADGYKPDIESSGGWYAQDAK